MIRVENRKLAFVDALQDWCENLQPRVVNDQSVATRLLSDIKARVRYEPTLRRVAQLQRFERRSQLVERVAATGSVPHDIELDITLALAPSVESALGRAPRGLRQ